MEHRGQVCSSEEGKEKLLNSNGIVKSGVAPCVDAYEPKGPCFRRKQGPVRENREKVDQNTNSGS